MDLVEIQEKKEYKGENFQKVSFSGHSFTDCIFTHCHFQECDWRGVDFQNCLFRNCNIHLVKLDKCRFQDVVFEESKIVGAEFYKCGNTFFSIEIKNSILMSCNFSDLRMKKFSFRKSKLITCYFNNTYLVEADFRETDLAGTIFHQCDLSRSDFSESINYSINPQSNIIKKAIFTAPEVLSLLSFFDIKIS